MVPVNRDYWFIRMKLKKLVARIHLWLGLPTGLVVLIIGITGAIYCFAPELQNLQPYRTVKKENKSYLHPSQIRKIAESRLPGKTLQRIYYDDRDKSVMALFGKKEEYSYSVFINPYSGEVLKLRNNHRDFLSVVLQIHRTLKIPFGYEIIRWSTVIFLLLVITGIILWWPKNKRTAKQGFRIMWRASPKRLNYDLHKVLGFYISWIAIFTALTGLMFAFEPFANVVYRLTGVGHSIVQKKPPLSDTTGTTDGVVEPTDLVWQKIEPDLHKRYAAVMFVLPATKDGPILLRANPEKGTLYKTDFRYFDQHNGIEIPGAYVWGRYRDARITADYIRRMNYDIHTGAIFGLPGRIALFFVAFVVASLPITGFYFWWGKKRKAIRLIRLKRKVSTEPN
jgi:uncharacterized iron-regulated membrane protein